MVEDYREKLQNLLRKLFQFDSADLDFGIYRIMNRKRDHIESFIRKDLINAVDVEFARYSESKQADLKEEFEKLKNEVLEKLGPDAFDENDNIKKIYIATPFAKELAGKYEEKRAAFVNSDMALQHKAEVFSHIYQFFSRYYDRGDFMSLRRYSRKEKYAIPYNGEEVVLHWANKDQYYIKTGEYFKNYSFRMGDYAAEFRIVEAEGTINNNKSENRFFVQSTSLPAYDASKKSLTIFFEYRGLNKDEETKYGTKNLQDAIISKMKAEILSQVQEEGIRAALNKIADKETERTVIEKHLRAYTQRNTTDYFIHKNLKGFLTQELDFYIKNEIFHLDDLATENEVGAAQYMSRMRVIKSICLKIIDFLAQIEDFQKMLFEKKKFVIRTDYCMTIDKVPPELYPEILKNKEQLNEWKALYGAGDEKQSTITSFGSKSIDEAYLNEHPYLALDTKFFDQEFRDKLLASFDDLDEATGGLMIKSENWQALNLIQEKYREKVKCIYIDPPYNTGNDDGFAYKDNYQHSSWLTMMQDRLSLANKLLSNCGVTFVSIDDRENSELRMLMDIVFNQGFLANFVRKRRTSSAMQQNMISQDHEYVLSYGASGFNTFLGIEKDYASYSNPDNDPKGDWMVDNPTVGMNRDQRPNQFYDLIDPKTGNVFPANPNRVWAWIPETMNKLIEEGRIIFPKDKSKKPQFKRYKKDLKTSVNPISTWIDTKIDDKQLEVTTLTAGLNTESTQEIQSLFKDNVFNYSKPTSLVYILMKQVIDKDDIASDFFSGSGTTAQAVLNLNKEDNGKRKYILIEMGTYFDTIMKPRIQKVMYSKDWKEGKPQSTDGISHIFKYQYLEQYEDTLNNIEFKDAGSYQRTLSEMDGYFLRYMLDFETREDSPCRFNVEKLTKPFDYTLRITHGNELKDDKVDLVETFNYLLGIHVRQIKTFNSSGTYRVVFGRKNEDEIIIIWRDTDRLDLKADKAFIEGTILGSKKPSKVYINADFYVEGALPIEPEFKKLMVV